MPSAGGSSRGSRERDAVAGTARRIRYHELLRREVVDSEGVRLGRIVDLVAVPVDDGTMRVTTLLVGYRALFERIVTGVLAGRRLPELEIPWSLVRSMDGVVRLSLPRADLVDRRAGGDRRC